MTELEAIPLRARVNDFFRPARLYAGIDAQPNFVLPVFLFIACVMIYSQTAVGTALPRIVPSLLERSQSTETDLVRAYRLLVLVVSFLAPVLFVALTATVSWLVLRFGAARTPYPLLVSLVAYASLWVGVNFLVKAALVLVTDRPEPPLNLSLLFRPRGHLDRAVLSLTNPFLLLAAVWVMRGLRSWGVGWKEGLLGGAVPWLAWMVVLALASGGSTRFAPSGPVSQEGWRVIENDLVVLKHPRASRMMAEELATVIDGFSRTLGERFGFEPRKLRVRLYRDHAELERATGEFLHVQVTGSIRGQELLYLETPGRSLALPQEAGMRDALRYVAIMQLAPVATETPRWFTHGIAYAITQPSGPELERRLRETLLERGVPTYEDMLDPKLFRTPQGPILAASLAEFITAIHGREGLEGVMRDAVAGTPFRDALFARTRMTTTTLETRWQARLDAIREGRKAEADSVGLRAPAEAEEDVFATEREGEGS